MVESLIMYLKICNILEYYALKPNFLLPLKKVTLQTFSKSNIFNFIWVYHINEDFKIILCCHLLFSTGLGGASMTSVIPVQLCFCCLLLPALQHGTLSSCHWLAPVEIPSFHWLEVYVSWLSDNCRLLSK